MTISEHLLLALKDFSQKYQFSFQFWGAGKNNVFIMKDFVELYSSGDHETIEDAIKNALDYVYRINRTPIKDRVQ